MLVKTKYFGEIDLDDNKVVTFDDGILGFSDYKRWTILFDIDEQERNVSWLQSLDEPNLAIPVLNPFSIIENYNPTVNDDYLVSLGEFKDEELIVLNTMTVPEGKAKEATANLKAPFVINSRNNKGVQVIVEGDDYPVKYKIYDAIQALKKKGER